MAWANIKIRYTKNMVGETPQVEHVRHSILDGRRSASKAAARVFTELVAERAFTYSPEDRDTHSPPEEPDIPLAESN